MTDLSIRAANFTEAGKVIALLNNNANLQDYFRDFYSVRWVLLGACALVVLLSFVIIVLMRCCAAPIIYGVGELNHIHSVISCSQTISVLIAVVAVVGFTSFLWYEVWRTFITKYGVRINRVLLPVH